jgi:hypothetical protein
MTAPNLRAVSLSLCFHEPRSRDDEDIAGNKLARIAAPRLEEIGVHFFTHARPPELDIRGLTSVRRLARVWLSMHGKYCRDTDVGLGFLAKCPRAEHVSLWLVHNEGVAADGELLDLAAAEGAPPFANVRSMDISAWKFPACDLVASVSSLLMRCPRLRSLRAEVDYTVRVSTVCSSIVKKKYYIRFKI